MADELTPRDSSLPRSDAIATTLQRPSESIGQAPTQAADSGPRSEPRPISPIMAGEEIGRYRVVAQIGRGGMGVVYRAHDPQLDREVALKLLVVGDEGSAGRSRLLREARAAAKVQHPNVVAVHDAGEIAGRVFIAMELVDGITLRAWLAAAKRPWRSIVEHLIAAGEGLAAAHAAGLVHRDFKPENVMVERSGRVRVLDFGLARDARTGAGETVPDTPRSGGSHGLSTITQTGSLVGTPAYMSPEQFSGITADARTDQFSFCVTAFEALYGVRPFAGETREALTINVLDGNVVAVADADDVPPALLPVLRRGLSAAPRDRHPSVHDLLAHLRAALQTTMLPEPPRRSRVGVVIAATLVGGVGALVVAGLLAGSPGEVETPAAARPEAPLTTPAPPAVTAPVPAPVVVPEVVLPAPTHAPQAALVRLLARVAGPGIEVSEAADGIRVRGEAAARWVPTLQGMIAAVDRDAASKSAPARPFAAPDERVWTWISLGGDARDDRIALLTAVAGVRSVHHEAEIAYALVEGPREALDAAQAAVAAAMRPKYRQWCYKNENMDVRKCHGTQALCVQDADLWGGPGTGKRLCRGVL